MGEEQMKVTHRIMASFKDLLGLLAFVMALIIAYAFRDRWWPFVYENSFGLCRWPSVLDVPCLGFCCAKICSCCCPHYTPKFRLRVCIHQAEQLRSADIISQMQVYCVVKAGYNPPKTTMIQPLPRFGYPVEWNETLDLEIAPSISHVSIEVMDHDIVGSDDVVGICDIEIADIYHNITWGRKEGKDGKDVTW